MSKELSKQAKKVNTRKAAGKVQKPKAKKKAAAPKPDKSGGKGGGFW